MIAVHLGVAVMLTAVAVNMVELAEREGHKAMSALQPNFSYATVPSIQSGEHVENDEHSRGAKEEVHHGSASYGAVRRSHAVSGTL